VDAVEAGEELSDGTVFSGGSRSEVLLECRRRKGNEKEGRR
jgi:hypothetical protein